MSGHLSKTTVVGCNLSLCTLALFVSVLFLVVALVEFHIASPDESSHDVIEIHDDQVDVFVPLVGTTFTAEDIPKILRIDKREDLHLVISFMNE
jgi:Mn2+/Fe2+ NRAMP family transporter